MFAQIAKRACFLSQGEDFNQDKTGVFWPFMLQKVEFMEEIMTTDGNGITCVVADDCLGWAPEITAMMGIPLAVFFP